MLPSLCLTPQRFPFTASLCCQISALSVLWNFTPWWASAPLWFLFRCLSIVTNEDPPVNVNLPQNLQSKGAVTGGLVRWRLEAETESESQSELEKELESHGETEEVQSFHRRNMRRNRNGKAKPGSEPVDQSLCLRSLLLPYTPILHMGNLRTFAL